MVKSKTSHQKSSEVRYPKNSQGFGDYMDPIFKEFVLTKSDLEEIQT